MFQPPSVHNLPAGYRLRAGLGYSTVLPDLDFETFSEAGYVWNESEQKWGALPGASGDKKGLSIVGTVRYCQHPTARVLSLAYNLKNGSGPQLWRPGDSPPADLIAYVLSGGVLEAHNSAFEYWVWNLICRSRYGFPSLEVSQLRCSMAKARAYSLPGALKNLTEVMPVATVKDPDGDRLLKKFSVPRNPTKNDKRLFLDPATDPVDGPKLYAYNLTDIKSESEVSALIPDLEGDEADYFLIDRTINVRGVHIDRTSLSACCSIVTDMLERNEAELREITGGVVETASQLERLKGWLGARGIMADSLDEDGVEALLSDPFEDPVARRALEIRQAVGSASVKKVFAMRNQLPPDNRLRELFNYHGARTGRPTGEGPQPTNLPKAGPSVKQCPACTHWFGAHIDTVCPWCNVPVAPVVKAREWTWEATEDALAVIRTCSVDSVAHYFQDVMLTVSGSLRGLFTAAPGHVLMCSDYSAIEGVVIAALSGEQWRLDVFATHGKIYELSASKITGIPFEEYARYKAETGQHHPTRGKVGKVAELALGFGGWVNSWKAFAGEDGRTDDEIKQLILAWREASPNIVEFWGGQGRGKPWGNNYTPELFGLEGMAIRAILEPDTWFDYRGTAYRYSTFADVLFCRLVSGRYLSYHKPRLARKQRFDVIEYALSYETWNSNPKYGPQGWVRMDTYSGRLAENVVQATARDIQRHAQIQLEKRGYPVVLHVYDENVSEVPIGYGSIEEFESILMDLPEWAKGWPIKAAGGWVGERYRKD
jgi:DNA polymerase